MDRGCGYYMEIETVERLVKLYEKIPKKTRAICLKYHYIFNSVNVNLYFDAFDKRSLSFCIILVADKQFYFTPLNILKEGMNTEYLPDIPFKLLRKILVDNKLNVFYKSMETHILQDTPYINFYSKDKFFTNTVTFNKGKIELPFWQGVRKVRMSNDTLIKLSHRADISIEVLRQIQKKNLTLVRTSEPERRRDLTLILNEQNITL